MIKRVDGVRFCNFYSSTVGFVEYYGTGNMATLLFRGCFLAMNIL